MLENVFFMRSLTLLRKTSPVSSKKYGERSWVRDYFKSSGIIKAEAKCNCKENGSPIPYEFCPSNEISPAGWFCPKCGRGHIQE